MANNNSDIFTQKVKPIMDSVRADLQNKQADEYEAHSNSMAAMFAGAAGPDGGAASTAAVMSNVYTIGKWSRKTTEDYIGMVKAELKKKGITVDAKIEKKMIDYLVSQRIPQSSAEYIMKKAAEGSLFFIPERVRQSSLDRHIEAEAENRYKPAVWEDITGNVLSWGVNYGTTMGAGGFWGQTALDLSSVATDSLAPGQQQNYLVNQAKTAKEEVEAASKKKVTSPKWMLNVNGLNSLGAATDAKLSSALKWATSNAKVFRDNVNSAVGKGERTIKISGKTFSVAEGTIRAMEYDAFANAIQKEQTARLNAGKDAVHYSNIAEADEHPLTTTQNSPEQSQTQAQAETANGNYSGWNNLLGSMGLGGIGDTFNHLGVTLAMLPDMLLGIFTGKTKSVGLNQSSLMPLAALIGGSFIKNPFLKIPLMLYGGANLFNKLGQESLNEYREEHGIKGSNTVMYKRYEDEALDKRISNPHVESNVLIVDIDNIPRIITLPQTLVDAYNQGAIPLNTLANRILAKTDQMSQNATMNQAEEASRRYEQSQQQEQSRGIR